MRKVAPAFEQWATQQAQREERKRAAFMAEFEDARRIAGEAGYLLEQDALHGLVEFHCFEASKRHPDTRADCHFRQFTVEIDGVQQTMKGVYRRHDAPYLRYRRPFTLIEAVRIIMAAIEEQMPRAKPKLGPSQVAQDAERFGQLAVQLAEHHVAAGTTPGGGRADPARTNLPAAPAAPRKKRKPRNEAS
jgi:hypothetical protein